MWRIGLILAFLLIALPLAAWVVTPPSTLMLARWLTFRPVEREVVPLSQMGRVPRSVLAAEDARFCEHDGVDWRSLSEVIERSGKSGPSRGASTIPMQNAKNLFLWHGRSYVRKALEIPLALWLDLVWSKRRMLEIYLNMAEWGDGVFGVEAAARHYFGKPAARLSAREAALLAGALPNPRERDPAYPGPFLSSHAGEIAVRARAVPAACIY